ncbi:MAG TPA: hypothetical protein DHD79_04300 [Firmicutes bacterium]|nr:hypothetical protein [Bacillota bacterium]HAW71740.1 hypothetical protein [Bacillota bacterium]HAZ21716.1 hypothetical protein [Bacillota bacterium]HBE06645.1 hypothetical protein [Bacillota bacterium]HBR24965.1 hypothetical protein [Bacillota bacterium]
MTELQEPQLLQDDIKIQKAKRPKSVWFILIFDILVFCYTLLAARDLYWMGGQDMQAVILVVAGLCYLTLGIFCFRVNIWALAVQGVFSLIITIWYTIDAVRGISQALLYYHAAYVDSEKFWFLIKQGVLSSGPRLIVNIILFVLSLLLFLNTLKTKRGVNTKTKRQSPYHTK